jgi:hypothetical protein
MTWGFSVTFVWALVRVSVPCHCLLFAFVFVVHSSAYDPSVHFDFYVIFTLVYSSLSAFSYNFVSSCHIPLYNFIVNGFTSFYFLIYFFYFLHLRYILTFASCPVRPF